MTRTLGAATLLAISGLLELTACVGPVPNPDPTPSEVAQVSPTPTEAAPDASIIPVEDATVDVDPAAFADEVAG
ncbi:hypothetical protein [Agromyces sp. Soil535]|uniref:hypothetical protein n=1 Tax=Agromyces sp. Soil535 TaxID=1736390 RepID=UPI0006F4310D|nr:hypothetical protein [Agromyces sp. Soil535]KRE21627.1 hypothetical protein ASG80_13560 [Agromyces sp. Soil535]